MKSLFTFPIFTFLFVFHSALFAQSNSTCNNTNLGSINFKKYNAILTLKAKKKLDSLIIVIKNNPRCRIIVTGYSKDMCDKCASLSWDRAQAALTYLYKGGIPQEKMLFNSRLDGELNTLSFALDPWAKDEEKAPAPKLSHN